MTDFIQQIPGPIFLLLYILYAAVIIILAKYLKDRDATFNLEIPETTSISAIDTALLNKGIKGAIICCIFDLWQKKMIDISKQGKSTFIKKRSDEYNIQNPLETAIFNYLKKPKLYRHFFNESAMISMGNILQNNLLNLQKLKLAADQKTIKRAWIILSIAMILILSIGLYKLYLGIIHEKAVIFLIICIISAIYLLFYLINPFHIYTTALGRKFLKNSAQRFEWLKAERNPENTSNDMNLSYFVAVFGVSALNGNIFSNFKNPNEIASTLDYGCGGGGFNSENCSNAGGCAGGGCSTGCGGGCGGCGGN
ncbi:MAG: TIGR04222 domain-containing membrane protein [Bacteroidales bacterium]